MLLCLFSLITLVSSAAGLGRGTASPNNIQEIQAQNPGYPFYEPTTTVRLMVVVKNDIAPFLTGLITTQGDKLVVANIINGDPPTAFNYTVERGFQAQNGKYIYFDYKNYVVRLDDEPHNETQYLSDGRIFTTTIEPYVGDPNIMLCPGDGNVHYITYYHWCDHGDGAFIDIYPIPPQGLTELWENRTRYGSPKQRGWQGDFEDSPVGFWPK